MPYTEHCKKRGVIDHLLYGDFHKEIVVILLSPQCGEALNEFFYFIQMEGDSFLKYVPTRWLSLLPAIEKMLKCWPAIKSNFKVWHKKNVLLQFGNMLKMRMERKITVKQE